MDHTEAHWRLIKAHLLDGRPITAIEALNFYQCMNLKGRIFELRVEPHNLPIQKAMIKLKNGKRVAKYYLLESSIKRIKQNSQCHAKEETTN